MKSLTLPGTMGKLQIPQKGLLWVFNAVLLNSQGGIKLWLETFQRKSRKKDRSLIPTIQDSDGTNGAEINILRKEINDLLDSEETLWHQSSKIH